MRFEKQYCTNVVRGNAIPGKSFDQCFKDCQNTPGCRYFSHYKSWCRLALGYKCDRLPNNQWWTFEIPMSDCQWNKFGIKNEKSTCKQKAL